MAKKGTTQGAQDAKKPAHLPPYKKMSSPKGDGMLSGANVQRQKITPPQS